MLYSWRMASERTYTVVLRRDEGGWYTVTCPAIEGCVSQGRTREQALANIREAIEVCLEAYLEDGEPLPEDVPVEITEARAKVPA